MNSLFHWTVSLANIKQKETKNFPVIKSGCGLQNYTLFFWILS